MESTHPDLALDTNPAATIKPTSGDDFDLFVRDDEEADIFQGPPKLTGINVRRPPKQSFVRFSPDPAHTFNITCLAYQDEDGGAGRSDRAYYPILPDVAPLVLESVIPVRFALYVTLKGTPALWPINMRRDTKGELNSWSESALTIVTEFVDQWLRIVAERESSGYVVIPGAYNAPPKWPELTAREIFDLAFGKRLIKDESHPLVQHLLGKQS